MVEPAWLRGAEDIVVNFARLATAMWRPNRRRTPQSHGKFSQILSACCFSLFLPALQGRAFAAWLASSAGGGRMMTLGVPRERHVAGPTDGDLLARVSLPGRRCG